MMKRKMSEFMHNIRKVLISPFILLIRFYQVCISPLKPASCRFTPTCSSYALQAFRMHGPVKGLILTTWRILRCNPWGGSGYDPVPEDFRIFRVRSNSNQ